MKTADSLMLLAAVAAGVYLIAKAKKAPSTSTSTQATEVTSNGRPWANGWRYFSDGTAIDPEGSYYQDGRQVWTAPNVQPPGFI